MSEQYQRHCTFHYSVSFAQMPFFHLIRRFAKTCLVSGQPSVPIRKADLSAIDISVTIVTDRQWRRIHWREENRQKKNRQNNTWKGEKCALRRSRTENNEAFPRRRRKKKDRSGRAILFFFLMFLAIYSFAKEERPWRKMLMTHWGRPWIILLHSTLRGKMTRPLGTLDLWYQPRWQNEPF